MRRSYVNVNHKRVKNSISYWIIEKFCLRVFKLPIKVNEKIPITENMLYATEFTLGRLLVLDFFFPSKDFA